MLLHLATKLLSLQFNVLSLPHRRFFVFVHQYQLNITYLGFSLTKVFYWWLFIKNCREFIGNFRYPPGCKYPDCEHFLMWNDTGGDTVDFSIIAKVNQSQSRSNPWTAIGFSNDTKMVWTKPHILISL